MSIEKHLALISFAFLASLLIGCAEQTRSLALTLDSIVARNAAVVGQDPSVRVIQLNVDIHDSGQHLSGKYTATRDGRMRIDILKDGRRIYTEAYDGKQGWDMEENGHVELDPHGDALWHGTQYPGRIFTLADMTKNGHRLEYVGRDLVDGTNYYVLKVTLSDGYETYRYVNPNTWMIDRGRDYRAFHPANDAKKTLVETVWSDYQMNNGVRRAYRSEDRDLTADKTLATQQITSVELNPIVSDDYFRMPATAAP